jgi:hypothetical protein
MASTYCKWCLKPLPIYKEQGTPREYCSATHKNLMAALVKARHDAGIKDDEKEVAE